VVHEQKPASTFEVSYFFYHIKLSRTRQSASGLFLTIPGLLEAPRKLDHIAREQFIDVVFPQIKETGKPVL